MTLKEILDEVCLLSGVETSTAYADNPEDAVRRLVSLANQASMALSQYPWQSLRQVYEFTLDNSTEYDMPNNFRAFIPDTVFTDSRLDSVAFPVDSQTWGFLQASNGVGGVRLKMRVLGKKLHIHQPQSGEEIRFEYLTDTPVLAEGGALKKRFTADDDQSCLDDELLQRDILWRYKKLMGLEFQADLAEAKHYEQVLKGQDGGAKTYTPGGEEFSTEPYYDTWRPVPNV